jgi:mannose/cellobiose epimerase-like protein (N-acyl-D-glucosamine 2-epimerase family)
VINARILWTFSAATRVLGKPEYREMADRAWDYINQKFWDKQNGGVYWMLDYKGNPIFPSPTANRFTRRRLPFMGWPSIIAPLAGRRVWSARGFCSG